MCSLIALGLKHPRRQAGHVVTTSTRVSDGSASQTATVDDG